MPVDNLDVLDVTVIHDNSVSGEQVNKFQFRYGGPDGTADATVLDDVAEIIQVLYTFVITLISIRNVLREVKVQKANKGPLIGSTMPPTYAGGTAPDPAAPQGTAAFCYFKTNVPRVILKKYLPSPNTGQLAAGGGLSTAAKANLVQFADELLDVFEFGSRAYQFGYLSPKTLEFEVPDIAVASGILAYQRRRKVGVGA